VPESPLDRLLKTPTDPAHTISNNDSVQSFSVRSPEDLASDGRRYVLRVDQLNQTAWIEVSGGIADHLTGTFGPWPLENSQVQQLLKTHKVDSKPTAD